MKTSTPIKPLALLCIALSLSHHLFSQRINEGAFNDWDYGPNGVYGNLPLTKTKARNYFKIEKADPQTAKIYQVNPSGIVTNTAIVKFTNGTLSKVEEINQWGETYEYLNYTMKEKDVFRVTDLLRGKNNFLPCKYALYKYKNDLLSEIQYYSSAGTLTEDRNGVAIIQYIRYDDPIRFAEKKETSFFDARHHPVISKAVEYQKLVTQYDEQDNNISEYYYGINNQPVTPMKGSVCGIAYSYDTDNNHVRAECKGIDGKLTPNLGRIAAADLEYSEGYLVKLTRYDSSGHMARSPAFGDGVSVIKYDYDNAGNKIEEHYFNEYDKPMNNHAGIHEIVSTFSSANMLTGISYLDATGNPCVNRDKIHTTKYVRDEKNRIVQESNYGLHEEPLRTYSEQVYMIKRNYDDYGRIISSSFWADSNTRMKHWNGYYEMQTKYNDDGQPIEYTYLDADGGPFIAEDGSSSTKLMYDDDGKLEERQFLHNGVLISRKRGASMNYSIIKYDHYPNGNVSELTFFNADRKPVNATIWIHDSIPVYRIDFLYIGNRLIQQKYYKVGDEQPFQILDCLKEDHLSANGISIGRKNVE